ncbi:MAG: urea ABC transporter permease subunit UrtC [Pseudomonadota bacterium]
MSAIFHAMRQDKGGSVLLLVLLAAAIWVPIASLVLPQSHALHMGSYSVSLWGKYMCFGLLALSLDIVWGKLGILSLGHGVFFGLGGYVMGMYLMRQVGDRGVYGDPVLPDFMVFLNWDALPWYWYGFDHAWFAVPMILIVPGLLAFVFGALAFRSRVTGVYLSIITQAMTYAVMLAFFRNELGFGGNNGLTGFFDIFGFNVRADSTRAFLFSASALGIVISYLLCRAVFATRLGLVCTAVRDAESRVRFLGYRTDRVKLSLFVLSACIAGVAGALYVPQVGIINPGEFSPLNSIEIVIWVALGGRGTLWGAVVGAILVNYAKTQFTGWVPEGWLFLLGGLFVLTTLYLPRGIAMLFSAKSVKP